MLDAAFVIAVFISILNLTLVFLKPSQTQRLQDILETFTLRLDDFLPGYPEMIRRVAELRPALIMLMAIVIVFVGCVIVFNSNSIVVLIGLGIVLFGLVVSGAVGLWNYASEISREIKIEELTLRNPARLLFAIFKSIGHFILIEVVGGFLIFLLLIDRKAYFKLQAFPAIVATITVVYVFLLISFPLLKVVLATLWRIVEHSSGALAALVILGTCILGVAQGMV